MSLTAAVQYAQLLSAPVPQPAEPSELARLSARERELVTLVARGRTDAQIADELHTGRRP
jgi:DNA-binding NarL/FixJ family response regulator